MPLSSPPRILPALCVLSIIIVLFVFFHQRTISSAADISIEHPLRTRASRLSAVRNVTAALAGAQADARALRADAPLECTTWLSASTLQPTFSSQFGQDATIYYNFFAGQLAAGGPRGVFVDAGANAPRELSNSYFFERCLGWSGVCIEANPTLAAALRVERSYSVVNKCVDSTLREVSFVAAGATGHIAESSKGDDAVVHVPCGSLASVLMEEGIKRADFMSIDIEGNELSALSDNDWDTVPIEIMLIESAWSSEELDMLLTDAGFWRIGDIAYLDDLYIRRTPLLRVPGASVARDDNWRYIQRDEKMRKHSFKRSWGT